MSLARAVDPPARVLAGEALAATMLPAAVVGTDPATVRMQDRFVEALAAATSPGRQVTADAAPGRTDAVVPAGYGGTSSGGVVGDGAPGGPMIRRTTQSAGRQTGAVHLRPAAGLPVVPSAALPARFRPLTTSLVARRVRIAHGSASRAALRAVGRPGATLGNVVHLASAPDASVATAELLAHELVHAANAPARPRFFAEPGHDAEERVARQVGRLARTTRPDSDLQVVRRAAAAPVMPRVVQRVEVPSSAPASSAEQVVRRAMGPVAPQDGQTIRRATRSSGVLVAGSDESDSDSDSPRSTTSSRLNELGELLRQLEQRVLNELERRGGRTRGGW